MHEFLSCDWGTSSFRLRLVETASLKVVAEEASAEGIAGVHRQWRQTKLDREEFYQAVIAKHTMALAANTGRSLQGVPVILSGMASSSIGMVDLPYKQLPFNLDGTDLIVQRFAGCLVVSGASTGEDVMRGEETKIVGCAAQLPDTEGEQLILLPGTHPKHVRTSGRKATGFQTFMTGEFFALLATQSVLAASVAEGGDLDDPGCNAAFAAGVKAGAASNLLHASFMVRTNQVLAGMPPAQNYFYLSGLLIGAELKAIPQGIPVYLAGGPLHTPLYVRALATLFIEIGGLLNADEALISGQRAILWRQ